MARWTLVLEAFTVRDEWGVRDLAQAIGIPKSACHRVLHDMASNGLLAVTEEFGRFRPGPALIRIANIIHDRLELTSIALPILEETRDATGETVIQALYDPGRHQYFAAEAVESDRAFRYVWQPLREWQNLYSGASGLAILAFLSGEEQEKVLADFPEPVPSHHPVSKDDFRKELALVRRRGYAVSRREEFEDAYAAAAPFSDARGRILGDLVITWPRSTHTRSREMAFGRAVSQASAKLSALLGSADEH